MSEYGPVYAPDLAGKSWQSGVAGGYWGRGSSGSSSSSSWFPDFDWGGLLRSGIEATGSVLASREYRKAARYRSEFAPRGLAPEPLVDSGRHHRVPKLDLSGMLDRLLGRPTGGGGTPEPKYKIEYSGGNEGLDSGTLALVGLGIAAVVALK